jgi:hypothetical protein
MYFLLTTMTFQIWKCNKKRGYLLTKALGLKKVAKLSKFSVFARFGLGISSLATTPYQYTFCSNMWYCLQPVFDKI